MPVEHFLSISSHYVGDYYSETQGWGENFCIEVRDNSFVSW